MKNEQHLNEEGRIFIETQDPVVFRTPTPSPTYFEQTLQPGDFTPAVVGHSQWAMREWYEIQHRSDLHVSRGYWLEFHWWVPHLSIGERKFGMYEEAPSTS